MKNRKVIFTEKPNFLFIALSGIGNLIMLTPAFRNIKENFPNSNVSVMVLKNTSNVLKNNRYLDEVIIYPSSEGILNRMKFRLELRTKKFDACFYSYPTVSITSAILFKIIKPRYVVNFYYKFLGHDIKFLNDITVKVDTTKHDVEKNLDLLRACNMKINSNEIELPTSKQDEEYVEELLKGVAKDDDILIGMHVGSNEEAKNWPIENFAKVAKKLKSNKRIKVVLIGSKRESELVVGREEFNENNVINLIETTSITQTTALLKRCRLLLSNDSGPMHMAVAAGTKVIAIFIASDVVRVGPFGKKHIVIMQKKPNFEMDKNRNHIYVDEITPEIVLEHIRKSLN